MRREAESPMEPSPPADELLRSARQALGTRDVQESIRELTLHALRSRLLTVGHIATVARTVGEGIESSGMVSSVPGSESRAGAWAGLEDAVDQALHALEVAARAFGVGRTPLLPAERDRMLEELGEMERSLGDSWGHRHVIPEILRARIASVSALLRRAKSEGASLFPVADRGQGNGSTLSCVASGVLLGLSEVRHSAVTVR